MRLSPLEERLTELLDPVIDGMGYRLVRVNIGGQEKNPIVQIMAENPETHNLGVDECAELSRDISALLDVKDPIKSAYRLEVSSPGIDRPLTRIADFANNIGKTAKIEMAVPMESGRKRFQGAIKSVNEEAGLIGIEFENERIELPFAEMAKAKLMMDEDLFGRQEKKQLNGKAKKTKRTTKEDD